MNTEPAPLTPEEWTRWTELTKRIRFVDGRIPLGAFLLGVNIYTSCRLSCELGTDTKMSKLQFVRYFDTMKGAGIGECPRGQEVKIAFAGLLETEPKEGEWFTEDSLPANILPEFQPIIPVIFTWAKKNLI